MRKKKNPIYPNWEDGGRSPSKYVRKPTGSINDQANQVIRPNMGLINNLLTNDPREYREGTATTLRNLAGNLSQYFLGTKNPNTIPSKYKPTRSSNPNAEYTTWPYLKNDIKGDLLSDTYISNVNSQQDQLKKKDSKYAPSYIRDKKFDEYYNYFTNSPNSRRMSTNSINLGQYSISPGKDDRGRYISIHDRYDWDLIDEGLGLPMNPWETYDRIYEDEWDKVKANTKASRMKKMAEGGPVKEEPRRRRSSGSAVAPTETGSTPSGGGNTPFAPYAQTGVPIYDYTPEQGDNPNISPQVPFNPVDQDVYEWTRNYIKSPKYQERLSNFYKYPGYIQRQRSAKASNVGFLERLQEGSGYRDNSSFPNQLNINPNQLNALGASRAEVAAHELGHLANSSNSNPALRINPVEENFILSRNKNLNPQKIQNFRKLATDWGSPNISNYLTDEKVKTSESHDAAPSENLSDIQALRYLLNKNKIYDARVQDITPEQLQKAKQNKEIMGSFSTKRLLDTFDDQGLIDILNKVAINNNSQNNTMAKNGKKIKNSYGGKMPPAYEHGGFINGSIFQNSFPNYIPNYDGNNGIPPKIYREGGFVNGSMFEPYGYDYGYQSGYGEIPPPKVYANGGIVPTSNSFAGSPFPQDYRWETYPSYVSEYPRENYNPVAYMQEAESGIHIKPENRGKFNATKKRTGKTTEELTHSKDPLTRKRAIFAQNASRWNKAANGGGPYGDILPVYNPMNIGNPDVDISTALQNPPSQVQDYMSGPSYSTMDDNGGSGFGDVARGIGQGLGNLFGGMTFNTAGPIMGLGALSNAFSAQQNAVNESATQTRRNITQGPVYNPYRYGTGSSALFANGGSITDDNSIQHAITTLRNAGYDVQMD